MEKAEKAMLRRQEDHAQAPIQLKTAHKIQEGPLIAQTREAIAMVVAILSTLILMPPQDSVIPMAMVDSLSLAPTQCTTMTSNPERMLIWEPTTASMPLDTKHKTNPAEHRTQLAQA